MNQADGAVVHSDRCGDHAGGVNGSRAVSQAKRAIVLNVTGKNGFRTAEACFGEKLRHSLVLWTRVAPPSKNFKFVRVNGCAS